MMRCRVCRRDASAIVYASSPRGYDFYTGVELAASALFIERSDIAQSAAVLRYLVRLHLLYSREEPLLIHSTLVSDCDAANSMRSFHRLIVLASE